MNEITYIIVRICVVAISGIITVYLIPYLKQLAKNEKYKDVADMVTIAVQAAEQTIKGSGKGEEKKQEVIAIVSTWLKEQGIKITEAQLINLIESAVYTMNNPSVIVGE